jgi:hypothetical protein
MPLMQTKSEAFGKFVAYDVKNETQTGVRMKEQHSDRGSEFTSTDWTEYLARRGIKQTLTVHDTPEHNRVAE